MDEKTQTDKRPHIANSISEKVQDKEISWQVHPLVENWKRSTVLVLFLVLLLAILYFGFQSIAVLLFSAFLLIGPLYKYFLPFNYHCGTENLVVTACCYKLERPWSTYRSYYPDKNGVLLSPFAKPSRLENFRGIYVRFGKHPSQEIIDFIHSKLNSESQYESCTDEN